MGARRLPGILSFLLLAIPFGDVRAQDLGIPDDLKLPSPWINSYEPRLFAGYKDNVLLSDQNIVASPFVGAGLDLTFFRLPISGWEFMFLSSAEYYRYLSAGTVHQEATAIAQGQVHRELGHGWKVGLTAEYLYFNQVFDSSAFQELISSVPVQGHSFTVRPTMTKDFGQGYRAELEIPATRQLFDQFIDNYWEVGPKLIVGREYGNKSDIAISYQFRDRLHDSWQARDVNGNVEPGRGLQFYLQELAATWRHYWDADRHWRTVTKLSVERNDDNGGEYYAYLRPLFSEQLRYDAKTWQVSLEGRVAHYAYDHERIGDPGTDIRARSYFRISLRGERHLTKALKAFAQYEFERTISNLDIDRYTVNTIYGGLSYEW
jgi:hypothetical protein